jgi:hypothetical protein
MITLSANFDLTIRYVVAADVVAILRDVLVVRHRARRVHRNLATITAIIEAYFRDNGGNVGIECTSQSNGRRFNALISTTPSKRFRHSNVIEVILRDEVRKTCGLELEKVYWCFPIREKSSASQRDPSTDRAPSTADSGDAYREEGLSRLKKLPGYQVTESSLEAFEDVATRQRPSGVDKLVLAAHR